MKIMKNVFGGLVIAGILISNVQAAYPDVTLGSILYPAVTYLSEKEVVQGYSDGTFGTDNPINRAEALKLILVSTENPLEKSNTTFSDVPTDAWFAPYIAHAQQQNIVSGNPDGTFSPARQVNRAEILKMIFGAFEVDPTAYDLDAVIIDDVPADAWFAPYMKFAVKFNILPIEDGNTVSPGKFVSRGEAAFLLYNTLRSGRGLNLQTLLHLSESHLVMSLDFLEEGKSVEASLAAMVSYELVTLLQKRIPEHPVVQVAFDTTLAIQNLIGAYVSMENGLLDDAITAAKRSWSLADAIQDGAEGDIEQLATSIKTFAAAVAEKAREMKEKIGEA